MHRFTQFLAELFNSVQPWSWIDHAGRMYQATFTIGDLTYLVVFDYRSVGGEEYWELSFKLKGAAPLKSYDITGTGNELAVFSTVIDILKAFLKQQPEARVEFEALEPSRQKLYDRMMGTLRIPGYTVTRGVIPSVNMANYTIKPDFKNRPRQLFAPSDWSKK